MQKDAEANALDCRASSVSEPPLLIIISPGQVSTTRQWSEDAEWCGRGENEADNNNFDELLFGRMIEPEI